MTARLNRALAECGDKSHLDEADRIERNSLCLFKADGFAASSYLVPYSVRQHFSGKPQNTNAEPKKTFGKSYDNWANDQDWILY